MSQDIQADYFLLGLGEEEEKIPPRTLLYKKTPATKEEADCSFVF
jgi:hypothetical protein